LSGEPGNRERRPPRNRHHLRLRPAAHLREPHHADDGAHGGCRPLEAPHVPLLHRRGAALGRENSQPAEGAVAWAALVLAWRAPGVWSVEESAWGVPHPPRLYRGRGDRPGNLPLL